jgi:hypothetical protein
MNGPTSKKPAGWLVQRAFGCGGGIVECDSHGTKSMRALFCPYVKSPLGASFSENKNRRPHSPWRKRYRLGTSTRHGLAVMVDPA